MLRDQSEDRAQSRYIVFGKETPKGVRYGIKNRVGEVISRPLWDAFVATKLAVKLDAEDAENAARKAAMLSLNSRADAAAIFVRDYERSYLSA